MRLNTALLVSLAVFIGGCAAIYFLHAQMSVVPIAAYLVIGMTGLAALLWPLLAVRALRRWIDGLK